MFGEHHRLLEEFPEYKDQIHSLKTSNAHFAKLYEKYVAVDSEIYRIEEGIETPDDAYTETLKKTRLKLKDEIFDFIRSV